jgi:hypothetical protein
MMANSFGAERAKAEVVQAKGMPASVALADRLVQTLVAPVD